MPLMVLDRVLQLCDPNLRNPRPQLPKLSTLPAPLQRLRQLSPRNHTHLGPPPTTACSINRRNADDRDLPIDTATSSNCLMRSGDA